MKKIILLICIQILLVGGLIGCTNKNNKNETAYKILKEQNQKLKQELKSAKEEIEKSRRNIQLRNKLDDKFYNIISYFKGGYIEEVEKRVTKNIEVKKEQLFDKKLQKEFILPKGNFSFRQIDFGFTNESETSYQLIYEIRLRDDGYNLEACYVDFILIDGIWVLDGVEVDMR